MAEAHIVPGLAHASLISTFFCSDAGCKVVLDIAECRMYYEEKVVLTGTRDEAAALSELPINPAGVPGQVPATIKSLDLHLQPN